MTALVERFGGLAALASGFGITTECRVAALGDPGFGVGDAAPATACRAAALAVGEVVAVALAEGSGVAIGRSR